MDFPFKHSPTLTQYTNRVCMYKYGIGISGMDSFGIELLSVIQAEFVYISTGCICNSIASLKVLSEKSYSFPYWYRG